MPDPKPPEGNSDQPPTSLTVKIGEEDKTFTVEDIVNLQAQQASATQASQAAAAAIQAAERYGVDTPTYVAEAESSFAIVQDLLQAGIIDDKGKPVTQTPGPGPAPATPPGSPGSPEPPAGSPPTITPEQLGGLKSMNTVLEALKGINEKVQRLEDNDNHLYRMRLQGDLAAKHPEFTERHISEVIAKASNDPQRRPVWQHAEAMAESIKEQSGEARKAYAKEFGINLDEFDKNKLREQEPGGGAGALFKGKKFSFKKGEGNVSPTEAAAEFFGAQGIGKG